MEQTYRPPLLPLHEAVQSNHTNLKKPVLQRCKAVLSPRWDQLASTLGWGSNDASDNNADGLATAVQVEDYPRGYPRFSALIASIPAFQIYRRFSRVRTRLLLLKQDRVAELETQLDAIDREETRPLFLGCRRRDVSLERESTIASLDLALAQYDELLERYHRIFGLETALKRHPQSLRNWTSTNPDLARDETAYLDMDKDLCYAAVASYDNEFNDLQHILSRTIRRLYNFVGKVPRHASSRDPGLFSLEGGFLPKLTRILMAWIVVILLLVPIPIIYTADSVALRMAVVVIFSALLIVAMSSFAKAKTVELFISGATYAAVLVVFISGNASRT